MADRTIYFHDGPCDGTQRVLTETQFAVGATLCKGTTYVYDPYASKGFELPVFSPGTTVKAEAHAARSFDPTAVAAAWGRLTHTLRVRAPHQIRRQHAANARLRRLSR